MSHTKVSPEHAAAHMDGIYRYQRFIYDATRRYYLLGRDRLLADLRPADGDSVLEVGCGTARNLIKAARLYPKAQGYGLDLSQEMLRTAKAKIAGAGLQDRVTVAAGDATAFSGAALFGQPHFDRVFISYALSMIPPWREAVVCAAKAVAPQGTMHIVDFGDFAGYPGWARRAQLSWLGRFSVTPIPRLEDELGRIAGDIGFTASATRLYGGYAVSVRLKRAG